MAITRRVRFNGTKLHVTAYSSGRIHIHVLNAFRCQRPINPRSRVGKRASELVKATMPPEYFKRSVWPSRP